MMIKKYVGRTVDIIYMDLNGKFTKRRVQVHSVRDGRAKVFCLERQAPRVLLVENILAVMPVVRSA
jgi:hypothetical protein